MTETVLLRITTVPISLNKLIAGQAKYMTKQGFKVYLASAEGDDIQKVVQREGVQHFVIPYTRIISPIKDIWSLLKTIKLIRTIKPIIVHTHTPKAGFIGMLAAYICRVPVRMHTVAGLPLLEAVGVKRKVLNFIERCTSFCATKVYPNSFELKRIMIQNNLANEQKTKVLGYGSSNGIDTSYFNPDSVDNQSKLKHDLSISLNDIVFCFVGRVVKDKGITELIDAFTKIELNHKNVKLLLVGPRESDLDPLSQDTLSLIDKSNAIIEIGYKDDIRPYLSISHVFVFPSYREGFPNVVMQAGAFNLPCIVSDINGCNELIINEVNGEIVEVKNTQDLFQSMKRVLDNKDYRVKLTNQARQLIVDKYEQQFVWSEILKEYKVLLNGKCKG